MRPACRTVRGMSLPFLGTKKVRGKVEIKVKDNGNGIPQKVLDKIFQPFFTTKPIGQGTGWDYRLVMILTKDVIGDLKVATKKMKGRSLRLYCPHKDIKF